MKGSVNSFKKSNDTLAATSSNPSRSAAFWIEYIESSSVPEVDCVITPVSISIRIALTAISSLFTSLPILENNADNASAAQFMM